LIRQYRETVSGLLPRLTAENLPKAIAVASIPEDIRGFGHVKERHLKAAKEKEAALLKTFDAPHTPHTPVIKSQHAA
jgi:indolepyruvate ferredoxin oxidoreductase